MVEIDPAKSGQPPQETKGRPAEWVPAANRSFNPFRPIAFDEVLSISILRLVSLDRLAELTLSRLG
jgi:hypothetical protein